MATSTRQASLFGVQDWKKIYQTYRQADFQSYDFETLRKSFIDYLTTYYPETFNDYTESSEFIALLDLMAFMGQSLAFRDDLNARENFIDTAERRDSVIKLANLVSYSPKRNTAGQGLIKVTAIATTEPIVDINGINLANNPILWNDPANATWLEQFNSIINAALVNSQRVGRPGHSSVILGVNTDEYTINLPNDQLPIVPFTTFIDGVSTDFELTSATSVGDSKLYEPIPIANNQMNIIYQNDKLGYGSPNSGYFFYFKQGALQTFNFTFLEGIQNNLQQIDIEGINNTDTWLYQLDANGNLNSEWVQTDNIYVNANPQGTSSRKVFSVASRTNDQVTYLFGDGVFGEIPVGAFRAYVRASNALTYTINPSEMQGIVVNVPYVSRFGSAETLTFTLSLQTASSTALQREPITLIKERAPARYYTQNRMVNGEDYTNFPFTFYNNIIKSKALNRTSIGVSRNLDLLDPSGKYSSTNVFATDGAVYENTLDTTKIYPAASVNANIEFLSQELPDLLNNPSTLQYYVLNYPRYTGYLAASTFGQVNWERVSTLSGGVTGYFYSLVNGVKNPLVVGINTSTTLMYIANSSQLKFVPPSPLPGQTPYTCFDKNNRLKTGPYNPALGDKLYIWAGVNNVNGDGTAGGSGIVRSGVGAIALDTYIPSEAILDQNQLEPTAIIPPFDNTLSPALIQQMLDKMSLRQNFSLQFDNSLAVDKERWSIIDNIPTDTTAYLISFTASTLNSNYTVKIHAVNYFFGSVAEVRFSPPSITPIYDQKSGQFLSDFSSILKTNSTPSGTAVLGMDYKLNIIGQPVQSDGYPNDFSVEVTTYNPYTYFSYDPDFFNTVVGPYDPASPSYVFFVQELDSNNNTVMSIIPDNTIVYAFPTRNTVATGAYEYPAGTVFYAINGTGASNEDGTYTPAFYQSYSVPQTVPPVLNLNDVTNQYSVARGRGALGFQYRHNSGNTTRIDPGTTNIIDLYLVTQAYYNAYQNWIRDITGTVPYPPPPTIDELQQSYPDLNSYKMISDNIVMNSVVFKPLFGTKADNNLQGTIKVIKTAGSTISDSQVRTSVLAAMNTYFSIDNWDFGDTFYMSELTAYLHTQLGTLISSVVLVPNDPNQTFGDLYEIRSAPYEIFVNGATANDIVIIAALTPQALQR